MLKTGVIEREWEVFCRSSILRQYDKGGEGELVGGRGWKTNGDLRQRHKRIAPTGYVGEGVKS